MKNHKCDIKKVKAWLRGLSFNVLVCFGLTNSVVAQSTIPPQVFEQQGGAEIEMTDPKQVELALKHEGIDVDHGCNHESAKLYITLEGYEFLKASDYKFSYIKRAPSIVTMKGPNELFNYKSECLPHIDFYPTYEGYITMMNNFATTYPEICELISIGTLDSGKEILVAHIGDDLSLDDDEPNFLYTSTMHGDETAGYIIMLQLIDYLLCNYENDDRVRRLVDNINFYINPLANPDGTYAMSDTSVVGASRRNSNFVDLHRNFPDPEDGPRPDNRPRQQETQFFMDFAEAYNIHLSSNIHGGAELVTYPWDTWSKLPADESWWKDVATSYVDSCRQHGPAGYMTGRDDNVGTGYDWYEVNGGRQDHIMYFHRGREMTIEMSSAKVPSSEKLPAIWIANKASLLNYMEEALYGLRGLVTDCNTGEPLRAEVVIPGYDKDNSSVFSDDTKGNYFRFLSAGTYELKILSAGYDTVYRTVSIFDKTVVTENIELCPLENTSIEEVDWDSLNVIVDDGWLEIRSSSLIPTKLSLLSLQGKRLSQRLRINERVNIGQLVTGVYLLQMTQGDNQYTRPLFIP